MPRTQSLRVPAVLVAAGTLLCACAGAGTTAAAPGPGAAATAAARVAATTSAPAAARTAPPSPTATAAATVAAGAGKWEQLLDGGTVTTTAAVPTITADLPSAPGSPTLARRASRSRVALAHAAVKPGKVVYLTFDDGTGVYSPAILALLQQYHAHATFFVIGRQANSAKHFVGREYAAGNGVGDHTWDHVGLAHVSHQRFLAEVQRTAAVIRTATGHAPVCLRPPGGLTDKHTRPWAKALGLRLQMWTIDTNDWRRPGARAIADRVDHHVHDGSVVLMHDGGGDRRQTVTALRTILRTLTARGYTFAATCR